MRQGIEEGRFQHFALAGGFGVAGVFDGARLLDGDGDQVDDGAQGLIGGERPQQRHGAQRVAAEANGRGGAEASRVHGKLVDFGCGEEVVVGNGVALRAGAEKLLAGTVVEGGGFAFEHLDHAVDELANGTAGIAAEHHGLHQGVEALDFEAALFGLRGAAADPLGELAGGHGGHKEGHQGDPVLGVLNGEGAYRFEEVVVEPEDGDDGRHGGFGKPPAGGDGENYEEQGEGNGGVVDGEHQAVQGEDRGHGEDGDEEAGEFYSWHGGTAPSRSRLGLVRLGLVRSRGH